VSHANSFDFCRKEREDKRAIAREQRKREEEEAARKEEEKQLKSYDRIMDTSAMTSNKDAANDSDDFM
jgi:hypothetical protein